MRLGYRTLGRCCWARDEQVPGWLPVPGALLPTPACCPACGPELRDIFVDGLFKLKHCAHVGGSETVLADSIFLSPATVEAFRERANAVSMFHAPTIFPSPSACIQ